MLSDVVGGDGKNGTAAIREYLSMADYFLFLLWKSKRLYLLRKRIGRELQEPQQRNRVRVRFPASPIPHAWFICNARQIWLSAYRQKRTLGSMTARQCRPGATNTLRRPALGASASRRHATALAGYQMRVKLSNSYVLSFFYSFVIFVILWF